VTVARFDWYQATVPAPVRDVLASLPGVVDGGTWENMRKAPHGYGFGSTLQDSEGPVLRVWWGGTHEHPHVVASGDRSPRVADLLRSEWPEHRVSRVDVCEDYADPGAYDRLQGFAVDVARESRVKVNTHGDHLLTKQGRTINLGSRTSPVYLRIYDKASELRAKFKNDPARLVEIPDNLARFEVEVKPAGREAKLAAAKADPLTLMGSSAWMRKLMKLVAGCDLEPFQAGKVWRQADDDRAYAALLAQYGGLLSRVASDLGSWECLGKQIGSDLEERAKHRRR
jgi:hypothetical protein